MLEKNKKVLLSALAGVLIAFIIAKGDRLTALIGSITAGLGVLGLSEWSIIIGIFCTVLTSATTITVTIYYKRKEFELKLDKGGTQ